MNALDEARRLAESSPWYSLPDGSGFGINVCAICGRSWEHAVNCPWLSWPEILAALETSLAQAGAAGEGELRR